MCPCHLYVKMEAHQPIGQRYVRQKELLSFLPFSAATLWRKVKAGTFVQPIKLSARITAWNVAEVDAWLKSQVEASHDN